MDLKIQIILKVNRAIMNVLYHVVFLSFTIYNAMASSLRNDLNVLDECINLGKTCDIVHVYTGDRTNKNEKLDESVYDIVRGTFSLTLMGTEHLKEDTFAFSKCLVLIIIDNIPIQKIIRLGKVLQLIKPVAFFLCNNKTSTSLNEINDTPFTFLVHTGSGGFQ